jgi:hypothetical protein
VVGAVVAAMVSLVVAEVVAAVAAQSGSAMVDHVLHDEGGNGVSLPCC